MNESTLALREEMSDLDWLARNVHVWPAGDHQPWCYVYWKGGHRAVSGNCITVIQPCARIEKADWLARRAELQNKPTIEQLAADYRNRKDYAERKQQEADAAKADAKAKLAELVAAGEALGLVLGVVGAESGTEQVIIDWRDLRFGDVIWYGGDDELSPGEYHVMKIETPDYEGYRTVLVNGDSGGHWIDTSAGWGFIRRPQ